LSPWESGEEAEIGGLDVFFFPRRGKERILTGREEKKKGALYFGQRGGGPLLGQKKAFLFLCAKITGS